MLALLTGAEGKCGRAQPAGPPEPSFTYCGEGGWVFLAPGDCAPVRDCSEGVEAPVILENQKSLTLMEPAPDWLSLDFAPDPKGPRTQVLCATPSAPPGEQIDASLEVTDILNRRPDGTLDLAVPGVLKTKVFVVTGPMVSISPTAQDFGVGDPIVLLASLQWQDEGPHDPIPLKWSVTDEVGEPFSYSISGSGSTAGIAQTLLPELTTTGFRLAMESPLPAGRYVITAEATFPGTNVTRAASASIRVLHSDVPRLEVGLPTSTPGDAAPGCPSAGLTLRLIAVTGVAKGDVRTTLARAQRRTSMGWGALTVEVPTELGADGPLHVKGVCAGDDVRVLQVTERSGKTDWDWWQGLVPSDT
ncbi:MAG: hypothetical protein IT384_21995 [Deltaproteobacteria bacterium]|nr:hypothetical protein [Deltaproteobacteria bacterium]